MLSQEEKATNAETWEHINLVMKLLSSAQVELMRRQFTHDRSKLHPPEISIFVEYTPKLRNSTYGSEEYKRNLAEMKPALDNHYAQNRHHPEFFDKQLPSQEIEGHIIMVNHAIKHNVALPDDVFGYESLINYLSERQTEHCSSVNNMNLFDLIEMMIDWMAACHRHADGDIYKSIEINQRRFGLSEQLVQILKNTVPWVTDEFAQYKTQRDLGSTKP